MSSIPEHKKKITEHIEELNDAIDIGIEKRPATIGFHCSTCSIQLLELYLHKLSLISAGKMIKHNWFERPKPGQKISPLIERKMPVSFSEKETIYGLLYDIEEFRNNLVYGKGSKAQIELVLDRFTKLRLILTEKLEELGEPIE